MCLESFKQIQRQRNRNTHTLTLSGKHCRTGDSPCKRNLCGKHVFKCVSSLLHEKSQLKSVWETSIHAPFISLLHCLASGLALCCQCLIPLLYAVTKGKKSPALKGEVNCHSSAHSVGNYKSKAMDEGQFLTISFTHWNAIFWQSISMKLTIWM